MEKNWDVERTYFNGDSYFTSLLSGLESARESIDLETYIFQPDALGRQIESALISAARRGVKVRLLVDGIGALDWIERRSPELAPSGVDIRVYHPIRALNLLSRLLMDLGLKKRIPGKGSAVLARLNRRTHRKMCLVDERRAWVGSLNIAANHCRSLVGNSAWRDTGAYVEGNTGSAELRAAFEYVWFRSHPLSGETRGRDHLSLKRKKVSLHPLVRVNYTRRMRWRRFYEFTSRLRHAQRRIWITSAYLAPSAPVIRRLTRAARRGVDVRLLVPRQSDVFFMPWVATSHYETLRRAGVRVYEYLPCFLHAKSLLIDDWATIGTSNMNQRSILHDFEVDLVLNKKRTLEEIERQFYEDLKLAEEILSSRRGIAHWLGRFVTFVFRNWI